MTAQLSILAFLILSLIATSAFAATPKTLGVFGKWNAWTYTENNGPRCFVYSKPDSMKPATLDHGDVSFFVRTTRSSEAGTEASFQTGYEFAPNSDILAEVGNQTFHMVASGNSAWLRRSGPREHEFLTALKAERTLSIAARSKRGNRVEYSFSLNGLTSAVNRAQQACP